MTTAEIYAYYIGPRCQACGEWKRNRVAFCVPCYNRLPKLLKSSLWQSFASELFLRGYAGCLAWFRIHPAPAKPATHPVRPVQEKLFGGTAR